MPKNNSLTQYKPTKFYDLTLDRLGGATLQVSDDDVAVRLRERRLRFLHFIGGRALRELDLSRCPGDIDLVLQDCPKLARIRLPEKGAGAVLHLDLSGGLPEVEVLGPVRALDACWQGGAFVAEAPKNSAAFRNAYIGSRALVQPNCELAVQVGDAPRMGTELVVDASSPLRQLVVVGNSAQRLRIESKRGLDLLTVTDCADLSVLEARAPLGRVRFEACRAIRQVSGEGRVLSFVRGSVAAAGVAVEGAWRHVALSDSDAQRLACPKAEQVLIRNCSDLREAELPIHALVSISGRSRLDVGGIVRLSLDGRAVASLLREAEQGGDVMATLRHWCSHARRPRDYVETLQALAASSASADMLWELRCLLHARAARPKSAVENLPEPQAFARERWSWRFPADLYQDGWDADTALWWRAWREESAAELEAMMQAQPPLPAVAGWVRALMRQTAVEDAARALLRQAVRQAEPDRQAPGEEQEMQEVRACESFIQAAVALRDVALADAVVARLEALPSPWSRLNPLAALAACGHAQARTALMMLSQGGHPGLRSQALSLALAPVRSTALAAEEVNYA